jgi:hypothetical protein
MQVQNKVTPSKSQIKGFFEPGAGCPIYMLNLLKFKKKAEYEDGRETNLTGAEAYALYITQWAYNSTLTFYYPNNSIQQLDTTTRYNKRLTHFSGRINCPCRINGIVKLV